MEKLATINNFTLWVDREDEPDNVRYFWELHNSEGKSVSNRVWMELNNECDSVEDAVKWVSQNVAPSDFKK